MSAIRTAAARAAASILRNDTRYRAPLMKEAVHGFRPPTVAIEAAAEAAAASGRLSFACVQHSAGKALRARSPVGEALLHAAATSATHRHVQRYLRRAAAEPSNKTVSTIYLGMMIRALTRQQAMVPVARLLQHAARQGVAVGTKA